MYHFKHCETLEWWKTTTIYLRS